MGAIMIGQDGIRVYLWEDRSVLLFGVVVFFALGDWQSLLSL